MTTGKLNAFVAGLCTVSSSQQFADGNMWAGLIIAVSAIANGVCACLIK